jgi:hypothetical protein
MHNRVRSIESTGRRGADIKKNPQQKNNAITAEAIEIERERERNC